MLIGEADVARMAEHAPEAPRLATEPVALDGVEILQLLFEIEAVEVTTLYPPALHPTLPPIATFMFWRVAGGPLGPFEMAQLRLGCRSGLRPRALLVASFVDSPTAARELSDRWGWGCRVGDVRLRRRYDEIEGSVAIDGRTILHAELRDPEMIAASDVQFTANLNPAKLERGFRLVQIDPEFELERGERGKPVLTTFDGAACGEARIRPSCGVSASFALGRVILPRVRYVCRADELAFTGTESL